MKRATLLAVMALAGASLWAGASAARSLAGEHPAFEAIDTDGNGEITPEELAALADQRFAAADADGDGLLTAEEMKAAALQRIDDRVARMIARMDQNGDGALSADEMTHRRDPARMFNRIDSDDSGTISKAEFDAAREKMQARMGRHGRHSD